MQVLSNTFFNKTSPQRPTPNLLVVVIGKNNFCVYAD